MSKYTLRKIAGNEYCVLLGERRIGSLVLHASGYADWSFFSPAIDPAAKIPSRTTQRKLLAIARAS